MALGTHAETVILVDSNTWADYFNDVREPHVDRLDEVLRHEEDLAVLRSSSLRSSRGSAASEDSDAPNRC